MKSFTLAILAGLATAMDVNGDLEQRFLAWVAEHGKHYLTAAEFGHRLQNWIKIEKEIVRLNNKPGATAVVGHNKFSDLSDEEYSGMLNYEIKESSQNPTILDTSSTPDSINWVELGGVNDVQDQGSCGSCWAFSAIASMEGRHFANTGELLKLSEQ